MLKNMKIAPKLILSFMVVVILASISGIAGSVLLLKMDSQYSEALVSNGFSQGYIGEFNTYLNKGGAVIRDIVMRTDPQEIAASQKKLDEIQSNVDEYLVKVEQTCSSDREKQILASLKEKLSKFRGLRDEAVSLGLQNKHDEAMDLFYNEADPVLEEAITAGQELMDVNVELGTQVSDDLSSQSKTTMFVIIVIIVLSVILSVIIAIYIANSISKPIGKVNDAAAKLAAGNLDIDIVSDSKDEVGQMTESFAKATSMLKFYIADITSELGELAKGNFNVEQSEDYIGDFKEIQTALETIIQSLNSTLSQINQAADQVSSGSDQVSSGAQGLSQGATEQASSVEELAATINEISQQINETAANADEASKLTVQTGDKLIESNQYMRDMIKAMGEITNSSNEIGRIIKTIEDIAFQTNILALNAAVEAARAGAAGKGFAVVADEVRNLASKSAEASKSTSELIEGTNRSVENGNKIAAATAESLDEVVEGSKQMNKIMADISEAANEQANAASQVTQGIDQISSVVQTNSATAEESAAASEELSGQAQMLKNLVSRFTLRQTGAGQPYAEAEYAYTPKESSSVQNLGGKY